MNIFIATALSLTCTLVGMGKANLLDPIKTAKPASMANASASYSQSFPEFEAVYPDGKKFDFSILKNKIVYVDFWATWCGPCKTEIPYLKKLEEEYATKGIVFLSVSFDSDHTTEIWKKFVANKNLSGLQIKASDAGAQFVGSGLKINSIPRFMIINSKGEIINANAPRPSSNTAIKEALNKALAIK